MDERLSRIKTLIGEIEEKESELNSLMGGNVVKTRAAQKCGICNEVGHTARTCTKQNQLPV